MSVYLLRKSKINHKTDQWVIYWSVFYRNRAAHRLLSHLLAHWLTSWLAHYHWFTHWLIEPLTCSLTEWIGDSLKYQLRIGSWIMDLLVNHLLTYSSLTRWHTYWLIHRPHAYSLIHSLAESLTIIEYLTHSLNYSLAYSLTHWMNRSPIYLLTCSHTHDVTT